MKSKNIIILLIPVIISCSSSKDAQLTRQYIGNEVSIHNPVTNKYLTVDEKGNLSVAEKKTDDTQNFILGKINKNIEKGAYCLVNNFKTVNFNTPQMALMPFKNTPDFRFRIVTLQKNDNQFRIIPTGAAQALTIKKNTLTRDTVIDASFSFLVTAVSDIVNRKERKKAGLDTDSARANEIMNKLNRELANEQLQVWEITAPNYVIDTTKIKEKSKAAFSVEDGSSSTPGTIPTLNFEDNLPVFLSQLRANNYLDENGQITATQNVFNSCPPGVENYVDTNEQQYLNQFASIYQSTFDRSFFDDFSNPNRSEFAANVDEVDDSKEYKKYKYKDVDHTLQVKQSFHDHLVKIRDSRGIVIDKFKVLIEKINDWQTEATENINILANSNMNQVGSITSEGIDANKLILETATFASGFNSQASAGMQLVTLITSVTEELDKLKKVDLTNHSQNQFLNSVADLRDTYKNSFREYKKTIGTLLTIALRDYGLLTYFESPNMLNEEGMEQMLDSAIIASKKATFKALIPTKGILVGFVTVGKYEDDWISFPDKLNPLEHLFTTVARGRMLSRPDWIGSQSYSIENRNAFVLLKVNGGREDKHLLYATLGDAGGMGLTTLRQLWPPDSIVSWFGYNFDKMFFDHYTLTDKQDKNIMYADGDGKGRWPEDPFTCRYKDEIFTEGKLVYSDISPSSFVVPSDYTLFTAYVESIEANGKNNDVGENMEIFGWARAEVIGNSPVNSINQDGYADEVLWKRSEEMHVSIGERTRSYSLPYPAEKRIYVKTKGVEQSVVAFNLKFSITESDKGEGSGNDNMNCDNCNEMTIPVKDILKQPDGLKRSYSFNESKQKVTVNLVFKKL